jgi:hypothetical protein
MHGTRRKIFNETDSNTGQVLYSEETQMKFALEGRMVGKKTVGKPIVMRMYWMCDERDKWRVKWKCLVTLESWICPMTES